MNVKTDTKEKFTVLTPQVTIISANMTEDIENLRIYASSVSPHLVINMCEVNEISVEAANALSTLQQSFNKQNYSFVICELSTDVKAIFKKEGLTELMNITPTESEAWDMVQMEELERELLQAFDNDKEGENF